MWRGPVIACLSLFTGLVGCAAEPVEVKEGFFGGVGADEPRAALIARDVMVDGGSAADAAVSMFFTLAVTLPSSAGLSAGGACLVFDPESKKFERLNFEATASSDQSPAVALPIGPRAMFALHARHGRAEFSALVTEAERLARFGEVVSRRLAGDLAAEGQAVLADAASARVFARSDAQALQQGDRITQQDLAGTLTVLRGGDVGSLYGGKLAKDFVAAVERSGFNIDRERLRRALPSWSEATGTTYAHHIWAVVGDDPADGKLAAGHLAAALDDTSKQVPGVEGGRIGATSFLAVDRFGMAVTCAIGLGRPFGAGRTAAGTGILLAPVGLDHRAATALGLLAANLNVGQTHFLATGRGDVAGMISSARRHYAEGMPVADAVVTGSGAKLFRCANGIPKADIDCSMGDDPQSAGLILFERGN